MTRRPTKTTVAGQRYLELQRQAKRTGRPTDELIQLYALECFLDRLTRSEFANQFVLKGGVLLAALDARRPTRDIDLSARALENDVASMLGVVREIAAIAVDDGLQFDAGQASAETIREEDSYSGVRVTLGGALSRANIWLHVDINVGDPIWPTPQQIRLPRLLDGELIVRGYPLEMVLAEKIVTAMVRGMANTRWRDFVDIHSLIGRHSIDGNTLRQSLLRVAEYRDVPLSALASTLAGYAEVAQRPWAAWLKKQKLESVVPTEFSAVLARIILFSDPVIADDRTSGRWDPVRHAWE